MKNNQVYLIDKDLIGSTANFWNHRSDEWKMNSIVNILLFILITLLVIPAIVTAMEDTDVNVRVKAPEYVSGTFEVTIEIEDVTDLDSGNFDLSFDSSVVVVESVEPGIIDDTEIPVPMWRFMDDDTIRVPFNLPGDDGVSGSGYLAKIVFEIVGDIGDTSVLDLSDISSDTRGEFYQRAGRVLSATDTDEISANWFGDNVTVGTATSTPAEAPTPTPTPTIAAASTPTLTATSIETTSLDLASDPSASTAGALDAPAAAVSAAPSEKDGLQDVLTTHNFIAIYSLIGLLAFIYTLTFK